MKYCMSDIHGNYDGYIKMLEQVNFSDSDTLYVVGDAIDRGQKSIQVLQDMMERSNVIPIMGNHEHMGRLCLDFLMEEHTGECIATLDETIVKRLLEWQNVGGQVTMDEFHKLSTKEKRDIISYIDRFSLYEEVSAGGKEFVLVHAGLCNFAVDRPLKDYQFFELLFKCPNYSRVYYPDKYLVTGHLPTRGIHQNKKPYFIYKGNNHIAIDCGSNCGGQLGMICLDTGEEFYVSSREEEEDIYGI